MNQIAVIRRILNGPRRMIHLPDPSPFGLLDWPSRIRIKRPYFSVHGRLPVRIHDHVQPLLAKALGKLSDEQLRSPIIDWRNRYKWRSNQRNPQPHLALQPLFSMLIPKIESRPRKTSLAVRRKRPSA